MTLPKIVELVTKKDIPALQRYLIFEVRKIKHFFLYNSADSMASLPIFCVGAASYLVVFRHIGT